VALQGMTAYVRTVSDAQDVRLNPKGEARK
jgi:hypothetical protein